ncbi:MAG TPA: bifunctional hydroxymethylpyrimidine kinase/phosphomethylpyrimidine kinase [Patescibacteria group bacterium]|nr:bifunctional hydroxymethylpyrimidine kinase/phosphomethylpyrimidine kinase [Patescibacteria group bacterium]
MKKALTIAGSDSSGGAGIQADLKAFAAHGVYGMSVITAVTAQNTQGVLAVQDITPEIVSKQLEAIFSDIAVDATKIGMLSRVETIEVVAAGLKAYRAANIVLDPVMISKSGYHLLSPDAVQAMKQQVLPLATLVTPNLPEAEALTGRSIVTLTAMEEAARRIRDMGPAWVLIKGGHREADATDILLHDGQCQRLVAERIVSRNTHGTGCTLSAAITAGLAKGQTVETAVRQAKEYISVVIAHGLDIGHGVGPTHHFYPLYEKAGLLTEE